jgi:hypothetical protein
LKCIEQKHFFELIDGLLFNLFFKIDKKRLNIIINNNFCIIMSASTSYMSGFSSLWTAESKYIIDFERGLVTHSKLLTKGQFNRWMSKGVAAQRP